MNILKPELVWVDGRCYRINSSRSTIADKLCQEETDLASENYTCSFVEEPCDTNVQEVDGKFITNVPVPSEFFRYIIGKKGETKRRIQQETKTFIRLPAFGKEGDIIVSGSERRGVVSAVTRINVLVSNVRQKTPNTHFVSVPFNKEPIQSRFLEFQYDVLRKCGESRGIDESIFQKPNKLHLTLGTLVLMDEVERQKAATLLKECQTEFVNVILGDKPIEVEVEGIEYMNDDPTEVAVLYAKLKHDKGYDDLTMITEQLVHKFVESGLMQQEYERTKLHLTVMNTLFRKKLLDPSAIHEKSERITRETFDANDILMLFGNYNFGKMKLETIEISQLHSKSSDGYYGRTAYLGLPT